MTSKGFQGHIDYEGVKSALDSSQNQSTLNIQFEQLISSPRSAYKICDIAYVPTPIISVN